MSANGELFITETLNDFCSNEGLINYDNETLKVPEGYYEIWSDRMIPTTGTIKIDGSDDVIEYEIEKVRGEEYGEEFCDIYLSKVTRGDRVLHVNRDGEVWSGQVDYIEYLNPIIADVRDGGEKLTQDTVDRLVEIIRAKIEFSQGLITELQLEVVVNSAYD